MSSDGYIIGIEYLFDLVEKGYVYDYDYGNIFGLVYFFFFTMNYLLEYFVYVCYCMF